MHIYALLQHTCYTGERLYATSQPDLGHLCTIPPVRRQTKTVDILTLSTLAVHSLHESLHDPTNVRLAHCSLVSSFESG